LTTPSNPLPETQAPSTTEPVAPTPREPVWNGWDVMTIVLVAIVGVFLFGTAIGVVLSIKGGLPAAKSPQAIRIILVSQFFAYILVLLAMWAIITRQYHRPFTEAVRWRWPERGWPAYLLGGVFLAVAVQLISTLLPIPKSLPIDRYFQDRTSAYIMTLFGISMAPLVEELFFRGFLFPLLARRLGLAAGVLLTAAGFAFIHASQLASAWAPLLILFVVGLVLTLVRVRSQSVASSFLMHVGYNATLFTILYIATDRFRHLERLVRQ
jgi:hypothetical protein